jgi:hypothetical protein
MRNLSKAVGRSAMAVSIVVVLAMPAQAKPRDGGPWFERKFDPIVKIIKRAVVKTLGDMLVDPRP